MQTAAGVQPVQPGVSPLAITVAGAQAGPSGAAQPSPSVQNVSRKAVLETNPLTEYVNVEFCIPSDASSCTSDTSVRGTGIELMS